MQQTDLAGLAEAVEKMAEQASEANSEASERIRSIVTGLSSAQAAAKERSSEVLERLAALEDRLTTVEEAESQQRLAEDELTQLKQAIPPRTLKKMGLT